MNTLAVVYLLIVAFVIVANVADIDNPLSRFFIYCWGLIMKYTGLARLSRWTNRHHPNG